MERQIEEKNYSMVLDADIRDFVNKINKFSPKKGTYNIIEIRDSYTKTCKAFAKDLPKNVKRQTTKIKTSQKIIPIRHYTKGCKAICQILYIHGGGFVMGDLESHDGICADLCNLTGLKITAVNYRLAPEHPYPAAIEDIKDVYLSLNKILPTIVMGDSAGATLSAILAYQLKGSKKAFKGQILIYPYLGGNTNQGSYLEHANAPGLTTKDMKFFMDSWMPEKHEVRNLPLRQNDFKDLPPTVVFTASEDPLYSDGFEYVQKMRQWGGTALHIPGKGLIHGFLRARNYSKKAKDSFLNIAKTCQLISIGEWPQ